MYLFSVQMSVILKFSILLSLQYVQADHSIEEMSQTSLSIPDLSQKSPIETLFGDGYICLHVTDPKFATSPAFQTLAKELAEKYNKKTVVHQLEPGEDDSHHGHKSAIHHEVTTPPPQNIVKPPQRPTTKPKLIPLVCERPGYFSNPNNCSKYFRCVEPVARGKPMKQFYFDCPPGTIFHEEIQGCNHPWAVEPKPPCWESDDGLKGQRGQFKTTSTTTTTTEAPEQEISQSHARPQDSEEQTPQRPDPIPDNIGQEQDLTDGSQELTLVPQIPVEQVTYHDNHEKKDDFDFSLPEKFVTDEGEIDQIDQTKAPIPFPDPEPEPVVEPICTETGSFGHPTNCSRYHQCLPAKGSLIIRQHVCPKDTIFDEEESECRRPSQVNPKPKCWHKHKKTRITEVSEKIEVIVDTSKDTKKAPPPQEPTDSPEVDTHFDEEESSGITQKVVRPGKHTQHNETKIITEVHEVIEESFEEPPPPPIESQIKKKTKIVRKEIPIPTGVKPAVKCTKEGTFGHPTDCNKYFRCERRGGRGPIRNYLFACSPVGTVYDESVHQCRRPEEILPNVPECAKWDNRFREQFEEEIEVEVSQEEQTSVDIGQTQTGWTDDDDESTTTPAPITDYEDLTKGVDNEKDNQDQYEIVEVDDGKGGKKKIKKKKITSVTTVNVVTDSVEDDEVIDSTIKGKKKKGSQTTTPHKKENVTADSSEEVDRPIEGGTKHMDKHHKETVTSEETPDHHHRRVEKTETKTVVVEQTSTSEETKVPAPIDQEPNPISQEFVDQETSGIDNLAPPHEKLVDEGDDIKQSHVARPDSSEEVTTTIEPWINKTEAWVTEDDGLKGGRGQTRTTKKPIPEDVELIPTPPSKNCDDDLELIERLRRERNAAEERADLLETENNKLTQRLKRMEKDLDLAVKAKLKLTNYVKTLDKTIESYKKEVEQLQQCCLVEREGLESEVEDLGYTKKGRKRRSVDHSLTSFVELPNQAYSDDEYLPKRMKVKKSMGQGAHLPIHATAETVDPDLQISLPIDSEIHRGKHHHAKSKSHELTLEKLEKLYGSSDSEFGIHTPILIFICLLCILLSALMLGCLIMRRLNKITTYGISAEELEAYARLSGETDSQKLHTLRHSTQKKALRQGVYFTYVDE